MFDENRKALFAVLERVMSNDVMIKSSYLCFT